MTTLFIARIVLLLTLLAPYRGTEPLYSGKPLAFWLGELKRDDPLIREEALAVLCDAKAAARTATPTILKLTHHSEPSLRAASLTALRFVAGSQEAKRAVLEALKDEAPLVRCRAVVELRNVDSKHPEILPTALELLKQPEGRIELLTLLGQIGPQAAPAVPTLVKLLADNDPATQRLVIQTLQRIGPSARPAVPALLEQLAASDVFIRIETVNALQAIGGDSVRIVDAVVAAAKLENASSYSIYLPMLAAYKAKAAAPWLIGELHRQPSYITVQLAETLYKIDPECARKEARPVLRKMLQPGKPWRVNAATSLRRLEPDNGEALQTLIDCAKTGQTHVRQQACQCLGTLGKSAGDAAPVLRQALSDSQRSVRISAAFALWQISGKTEATVPVLLEELKPSPDNFWRAQAAAFLGEMGAVVSKSALPQLRKYRDDSDPRVRQCVRSAIEHLESIAKDSRVGERKAKGK